MNKKKVFVGQEVDESGLTYLREKGYEVIYRPTGDFLDWIEQISHMDAMMTRSAIGCPGFVFDAAENLKVIGNYGVGVDKLDVKHATELGIQVTNSAVANMVSVAEQTIALILTLANDLFHMDREARKGNWAKIRDATRAVEIHGKVLGLVGCGNIGRKVAQLAHAFGMKVIAYKRTPPASDNESPYISYVETLQEVFSQADIVSLHVPLTEETYHLVDLELLNLMKTTAFIINCARGGIIREEDLYDVLKDGKIAGAGLDCFETEPVELTNPLLNLENVIIGPHSAGFTKESRERMSLHAAMGIDEVLSGRKPSWPVNFRQDS